MLPQVLIICLLVVVTSSLCCSNVITLLRVFADCYNKFSVFVRWLWRGSPIVRVHSLLWHVLWVCLQHVVISSFCLSAGYETFSLLVARLRLQFLRAGDKFSLFCCCCCCCCCCFFLDRCDTFLCLSEPIWPWGNTNKAQLCWHRYCK